jgi:hypothetical protein
MAKDAYVPIATASGAATTYTFSAIPGTFDDLIIRGFVATTISAYSYYSGVQFNGDTGSNYDQWVMGTDDGTFAGYGTTDNQTSIPGIELVGPSTSTSNGNGFEMVIYGYSNTSYYTNARSSGGYGNGSYGKVRNYGGQWRNTAAVTSITFVGPANFNANSKIALYGRRS